MPLIFIVLGALFIASGLSKAGPGALLKQLGSDFTGQNNFFIWIIAIAAIGFLGYVPGLKPLSIALLTLVVVVILLSNKGFFSQFANATGIGATTSATA